MRTIPILFIALAVVVAGCSTGGNGGDGTPDSTPTTEMPEEPTQSADSSDNDSDDSTADDSDDNTDDDSDTDPDDTVDNGTQANLSESLENLNLSSSDSDSLFGNATTINATLYNGSETTTLGIRNDTSAGRSILTLAFPGQSGETTYYETENFTAVRNTTSGEVRYGESDGNVGFDVTFASVFVLLASVSYVSLVEWEPAGQTTVNGHTAAVFEGDSLNQSAFDTTENMQVVFGPDEVESVDGRMVIGQDGTFYSLDVRITVSGETYGTDLSVGYEPVTVSQPGWVNESEAPN